MAASTNTRAPINDTDANFRLWGSAISAGILAAGWVQTADTGQINWTTVSKPASTNTSQGFEIWSTNDGLTTWYLKIEYGSGSSSANNPSIWLTVGSATNGSGTLSGQTSTRTQFASSGSLSTAYNCYYAGGTNWLSIAMFCQTANTSTYSIGFSIEKPKTSSGSISDIGICVTAWAATTTAFSQYVPSSGTVQTATNFIPAPILASGTSGRSLISGSSCGLLPCFCGDIIPYPITGVMGFYYTDIAEGVTFTVSRFGTNTTYVSARPQSGSGTSYVGGTAFSIVLAIRYE